mgnify:CR=1 FL=1
MIRRISTKWILTVLAAVMLPFLGFAWFVDSRVAERHWDTVRYYLLTTASEVADRVDNEIRERTRDVPVPADRYAVARGRRGASGGEAEVDAVSTSCWRWFHGAARGRSAHGSSSMK